MESGIRTMPYENIKRHLRSGRYGLLACAALTVAGCDDKPTLPAAPASAPSGNLASAPTPTTATAAQSTGPPAPPPVVAEGAATPGGTTEKAVRGVGEQGSKYGGGIVTEPVRQYFLLKQATVFEIQIPHALNLYHAEHNKYPKDWAEFKREILDPASIQLPELPEGVRYVYDGKAGELQVERPQASANHAP
jgi:hypothetical protein